jgi:hypothetical protein
MKWVLVMVSLMVSLTGWGQDEDLKTYLAEHQVIISKKDNKLQPTSRFSNLIDKRMKAKSLFVLGEGNHNLNINNEMLGLLQKHFASRGLKYCFLEDGRGSCLMGDNIAHTAPDAKAQKYNPYMTAPTPMAALVKAGFFDRFAKYEYVGIDFERPWTFYPAVSSLLAKMDKKKVHELCELIPELKHMDLNEDPVTFKNSYKKLQASFLKYSPKLKIFLGENDYEDMRYLVSNPNISTPNDNRDAYMATNLLEEIEPIERGDSYLLMTGFSHASKAINGSLVQWLSASRELQNKILVMNVYCDSCATQRQGLSDYGYMRDETLGLFRSVAKADLVVFDLSELPAKYAGLKEHGDLLLFARNQN